ncbi:hypothetical protein VNO77_21110 [Canavalia gladiata]|uniref:BHLH domain-containing protein n=1 Tax=Canavalia gladiata TaxID=3824 RepID=A0AAN9LUL1_CANGL
MEDPWEDLVSHREMSWLNEEEFLRDIIVEQQDLSPENDHTLSSNPSSSSVQTNFKLPHSSSYILSFDNSQHDSKSRAQRYWIEPRSQPPTKKIRNSCQIQLHILAERKRRQEFTTSIIALSASIPALNKKNKANVVREAVNYVKQLKERVKELENENRKEADSIVMMKKTQLCINDEATTLYGCIEELPEVEATILEKEVLIGILCEKQRQSFHRILSLLSNLHLSVTASSTLPFGTSTLKITIIAQMDEGYNLTIDDLVKTLRQHLLSLKSQDMQK